MQIYPIVFQISSFSPPNQIRQPPRHCVLRQNCIYPCPGPLAETFLFFGCGYYGADSRECFQSPALTLLPHPHPSRPRSSPRNATSDQERPRSRCNDVAALSLLSLEVEAGMSALSFPLSHTLPICGHGAFYPGCVDLVAILF